MLFAQRKLFKRAIVEPGGVIFLNLNYRKEETPALTGISKILNQIRNEKKGIVGIELVLLVCDNCCSPAKVYI